MFQALRQKLERRLPGAVVEQVVHAHTTGRWRVRRGSKVLSTAYSEREAIERALFLYGEQR